MPPVSRPRLKLHYLLLAVNLTVLWLPLLGLEALRLYDSALVRQTESELLAQAAFVTASYRATLTRLAPQTATDPAYGLPLPPAWRKKYLREDRWRPRPAHLDLAEEVIQPPPPDTIAPVVPPDPYAQAVGQELQALLHDAQVMTLAGIAVPTRRARWWRPPDPVWAVPSWPFAEVRRALDRRAGEPLAPRIPDSPPPADRFHQSRYSVACLRRRTDSPGGAHCRCGAAVANASLTVPGIARQTLSSVGGGGLIIGDVVIAMSVLTSFTVVQPLRKLVQQAQRATAGEKGAVTPLARPITREIADLSHAVTTMARSSGAARRLYSDLRRPRFARVQDAAGRNPGGGGIAARSSGDHDRCRAGTLSR
jgi:hypothetical protein